jgi:uncharacterized protein YkwD
VDQRLSHFASFGVSEGIQEVHFQSRLEATPLRAGPAAPARDVPWGNGSIMSHVLTLLLALASCGPADGPLERAAAPAEVREQVLARLNEERAAAGLVPLVLDGRLSAVAQQAADDIARQGVRAYEEDGLRDALRQTRRRLARAGYEAHGWSEGWAMTGGGVERAVGGEGGMLEQAREADWRHLGVGIATLDGTPVYTFVLAWPEGDYFARETAAISDLAGVREAMLERANALRAAAGAPPLAADARLDLAAQRHAEDMLARSYYDHRTPEGHGPRERLEAAGVTHASRLGENIARGQTSVEEVLAAWRRSRDHRRNLLHPGFTRLGVGMARGRTPDGWTVVWVQNFAG